MARRERRLRIHALFRTEAMSLRGIAEDFDGRLSRILDVARRFPEEAILCPWTGWSVVFCEQVGFPATLWYRHDDEEVEAMSIKSFPANRRRF